MKVERGMRWEDVVAVRDDFILVDIEDGVKCYEGEAFDGESSLYAWITDDGNRIPIYFVAPLKIGQVRGRLYSADGLKHEFSSVVQ